MSLHELNDEGRLDLYVYNEATAWTLSSKKLIEEIPISEDESWEKATAEGRIIAQSLYQDDTFHARIVLGELNEDEEQEWIGHARWWLRIPDGVLVLAAGGEFSWGWCEDAEDDEFVHQIRVPAGDYQVDIHTTLTGVNGLPALERAGQQEAIGAWWRRTRGDASMPSWLQFLMLEHLAKDPGHEQDWEGWSTARHHAVMSAVEQGAWIDWIVQLRPLTGTPPATLPELDEGCFAEPELRIPEVCPQGICGEPVNAEEFDDEELDDEPVNVFERVAQHGLAEVAGGPVEIPAEDVEVMARLAWFAHRDVDGEILVDGAELGYWAEKQLPADDCFLRTAGDGRFRVGFPATEGVYDLLHRLRRLGPACAALPDGASLELVTATAEEDPPGSLRLAGTFQSGAWQISHAWPPVDARTLQAAIDLAREAEGASVCALNPEELDAIQERWKGEGLHRTSPLVVDGLTICHDESDRFTFLVAANVFAIRFGATWPCPDPEDPMAEFEADDEIDLFESLAEGALPLTDPLLEAESGRDYFDISEDDLPADVIGKTAPLLQDFGNAGATHVGDLVCSFSPGILIRGVAEKQARWFGTVMVAPFVGMVTEAYTRFEDGTSITTTTNPFPGGSVEGSGILWNPLPEGTPVEDLVAAHLAAITDYAGTNQTSVLLIRQNLLSLCEAMEEFLLRRTG